MNEKAELTSRSPNVIVGGKNIYTVKPLYKKPLYKKNLFIRTFFTHLVGIQPFPHYKTSL